MMHRKSKECCPLCAFIIWVDTDTGFKYVKIIELDDGKIYRKPLYLMVKTMFSCKFYLKPIHWLKKNTHFLRREQHAYPNKTFHISLWCRKLCQEDAFMCLDTKGNPLSINILVSSCSCFAIKTCSIEANTTLSLSVAQPVKIEYHFSVIFIDSIQYFIAKMAALQHISTKMNFPSWLTGLLSGPCTVVCFCLMYKFGYVPYTHKTWSQKFLHNTYLYIYISL